MRSYRNLLIYADVRNSEGNCEVLDSSSILAVTKTDKENSRLIDVSTLRKNDVPLEAILQDHNYDCTSEFLTLTELAENIVTYMAGYVVKMLSKIVTCEECIEEIIATNDEANSKSYSYIKKRNLGPYLLPSFSVYKICMTSELTIRRQMFISKNTIPPNITEEVVNEVCRRLDHSNIFKRHTEHYLMLVKDTIKCYCKIRVNNLAKRHTQQIRGEQIRQQYTKLILFKNQ